MKCIDCKGTGIILSCDVKGSTCRDHKCDICDGTGKVWWIFYLGSIFIKGTCKKFIKQLWISYIMSITIMTLKNQTMMLVGFSSFFAFAIGLWVGKLVWLILAYHNNWM